MKFISIKFKNFMPYKGEVSVNFPQGDQNILLLYGLNAYGKTSFIHGIRWCLYGRIFKGGKILDLKKLLNNTAYDEKEYQFEVSLEFENEGSIYKLIRSVEGKEGIEFPQDDTQFKVKTYLTKDGNTFGSESEVKHQINLISPEPVSRFFLFDGELLNEYSELLETGSEIGEQIKTSIEQILGVPALINGKDDSKFLLRRAEQKQKQEVGTNKSIQDLINSRDLSIEHNKELESSINDLEEIINESLTEKDGIDQYTSDFEKKNNLANQLEISKGKEKNLEEEISKLDIERLEASKEVWKDLVKPRVSKLLRQEKNDGDSRIDKNYLRIIINELKKSLDKKQCAFCGNDSHFNQKDIQQKIDDFNKQMKELSSDSITNNNFLIDFIEAGSERSLANILKEKQEKEFEKLQVEQEIDEIRGNFGSDQEAKTIKEKYKRSAALAVLIEETKSEITKNLEQIKTNEEEISRLNTEIEKNPDSENSPTTKFVQSYTQLNNLFKESIIQLREQFKSRVEDNASKIFAKLNHKESYKSLKINDNYGLNIIDVDNKLVEVRNAGADQIIALSLIAGLAHTGRKDGPIVMDTPFGRLDLKHRKNILETLPNFASQLVMFVHDGEVTPELEKEVASIVGKRYEIKLASDKKNSYIEEMK